ncbi:MAG: hypothetical protein H7328_13300 [Bdellovibrio sp.]|nr:hypothetical protein [Bdellovibrio sp.]
MKTKNAVIIFFILLMAQIYACADEILIVDVRRNITLSDDEIAYKDFYLNAGEGSGLKKNLVINVKRRLSIKDQAAKSVGNFETVVGQMRIILVDGKVAVGREYKLQPRDEEPMLEQLGMMTGDRLDLAGSFIDNSKPKRKIAEVNLPFTAPATLPVEPALEETKTASLRPEVTESVKNPSVPETFLETPREPATQKTPSLQAVPEI